MKSLWFLFAILFVAIAAAASDEKEDGDFLKFARYCSDKYGVQKGLVNALKYGSVKEARSHTDGEDLDLEPVGCLLIRNRRYIQLCTQDTVANRTLIITDLLTSNNPEFTKSSAATMRTMHHLCSGATDVARGAVDWYLELISDECDYEHNLYCRSLHSAFLVNVIASDAWPVMTPEFSALKNLLVKKLNDHNKEAERFKDEL